MSAEWNRVRVCRCDEYRKAQTVDAVGDRDGPLHRELHPVLVAGRLDHLMALAIAAIGSSLQPQGQGEVEQHLGVGGPLDVGVQRRVDGEGQVALDRRRTRRGRRCA